MSTATKEPKNTKRDLSKRRPLNMRTTPAIRSRLDKESKLSGRSLAQEVEKRLEESFAKDDAQFIMFGGEHNFELLKMLGSAISFAEKTTGKNWLKDVETHSMVLPIIYGTLNQLNPNRENNLATAHKDLREYMVTNKRELTVGSIEALLKYGGYDEKTVYKICKLLEGAK